LVFIHIEHICTFFSIFRRSVNLIKTRWTVIWCSLMIPLPLPMIWGTYMKLVTKYQISAINSYTPAPRRGYTVLPLSVRPSKIFFVTFFSATIDGKNLIFGHKLHIGMKIGSKCVDLILIRLAKCWNYFFPSKFCIWLYCENVKSEYIFFSCPAKIFSSRLRIKIIFRKKKYKISDQSPVIKTRDLIKTE
jgi:hypothetical protein